MRSDPLETLRGGDDSNVPANPAERPRAVAGMAQIGMPCGFGRASTRGFHAALLGGTRRGANIQGDGMPRKAVSRRTASRATHALAKFLRAKGITANEERICLRLKPWLVVRQRVGEMRPPGSRRRGCGRWTPGASRLLSRLVTCRRATAQDHPLTTIVHGALLAIPILVPDRDARGEVAQESDVGELDAHPSPRKLPPDAVLDQ